MYQNGVRLNRHARKRKHIDNLKRRSTPLYYNSWKSFCDTYRALYESYGLKRKNTPWYEKYWEAYSGISALGWKSRLKGAAHREERQQYREYLVKVLKDLDIMDQEEIESFDPIRPRKGQKANDPWNWD